MKAKEYLRSIQSLGHDSHEYREQASALKDTLRKLSDAETIETVKTLINKLMDDSYHCNLNRQYMIAKLSNITVPIQYMVLLYRYTRNYSWSDIAYKLRITERAAKKIHSSAVRALDRYLWEYEDAEEE